MEELNNLLQSIDDQDLTPEEIEVLKQNAMNEFNSMEGIEFDEYTDDDLANIKNEIAELEKVAREAESKYGKDSPEAERARLNLLYKQRAQATLERNIGWGEKRVSR